MTPSLNFNVTPITPIVPRKLDGKWTIEFDQDIEAWIVIDGVAVRDYDSPMYKAMTTPIDQLT